MTQLITPPTLFRASAPSSTLLAELGPLADLPGTWVGQGFNLISLPISTDKKSFVLKLNATRETLTFTTIGAPIPDRGFFQHDIFFVGLHYLQQVSDAITSEGLHVETGMWLNLPETQYPLEQAGVARLSTIPHGDALLAQGLAFLTPPVLQFGDADSLPFTLGADGSRNDVTDQNYLAQFNNAQLPPGIPDQSQFNPNLVIQQAIDEQVSSGNKLVQVQVLQADAMPIAGINGTPINPPEIVGGIVNIPFIDSNARALSFSARFFIETLEHPDKSQFLLLQYTQTALLNFEELFWPHISVGTLVRQ